MAQPYGDLAELNTDGLILRAVGQETLRVIVDSYLETLGTSAAVYEKNGDYAAGIFSSGWCRFMDARSRELCGTDDNREALASGRWHCHDSCWLDSSKPAIEQGAPTDVACRGGIRLYAVPIVVRGEVVGSINFGYGTPPQDPSLLEPIAARYDVPVERLTRLARVYPPQSEEVIEAAKRHLRTTARLIAELIERHLTERERDQSELFLGILAHDLRNPLTAIATSAAYIERHPDELSPGALRAATRIQQSVARADRMVSQLLDFARARLGGGLPIERRRVDAAAIVVRVVDELAAARPRRAFRLFVEGPCEAELDPDRFAQIVSNLVGNADDHGAPGTPIDVRFAARAGAVVFEVQNRGPVLSAEQIEQLFVPMRRGERAAGSGLGLGLFIVKESASAHGGEARMRSSEAEGITVTVTIPRASAAIARGPGPQRAPPPPSQEPEPDADVGRV